MIDTVEAKHRDAPGDIDAQLNEANTHVFGNAVAPRHHGGCPIVTLAKRPNVLQSHGIFAPHRITDGDADIQLSGNGEESFDAIGD